MEIVNLLLKTEHGEEKKDSLNLIVDFGIEGDKKASGGDRQLCLASEDAFSSYREKAKGLCVNRFMPNITTRGLDYSTIAPGTTLNFSNATSNVTIEITNCKKKCFPDCPYVTEKTVCDIKHNCAFAKVITSGTIYRNQQILQK